MRQIDVLSYLVSPHLNSVPKTYALHNTNCSLLDPSFSTMRLPTIDTYGTGWEPLRTEDGAREGFEVCSLPFCLVLHVVYVPVRTIPHTTLRPQTLHLRQYAQLTHHLGHARLI